MHFHIGAWRALKEEGYLKRTTSLGGGSSGSLTAFLLASGVDENLIDRKISDYALMYPGILCWGKMSRIVGETIDAYITNDDKDWEYQPYAVVTNAQLDLPPVGPRFIISPPRSSKDKVKNLILSSCYIPIMYEKVPKWNGKFALDGGAFLMNITIPNTLTISPYMKSDVNVIGYEEGSHEEEILNARKFGSLFPDKEHLVKVGDCGYTSAKKWLNNYSEK